MQKDNLDIKPKGLDIIKPKKELQTVKVPEKPKVDISLSPFEWIQAKYYKIKTEREKEMLEAIKTFIVSKLVQWILKLSGGVLIGLGIDEGTIEKVIGGAIAFLISAVWSLVSTGKIALTDPKEILKIK